MELFNKVLTEIIGGGVLALTGWVLGLGRRVQKLEDFNEGQVEKGRDAREKESEFSDAVKSLLAVTVKLDTLLETALKRLDMIEKKVFQL